MRPHQHVQSGNAVGHMVFIAVAFGQVAGDLLIESVGDLLAFLLEVEGHGGVGHDRSRYSDHAVGSHDGAVSLNVIRSSIIVPACRYGSRYGAVRGHDVSAGLIKAQRRLAGAVGGNAFQSGELTAIPGADGHTGDGLHYVIAAAHLGHAIVAGEIQLEGRTGLYAHTGLVKSGVPVGVVPGVLQNGGVKLAAILHTGRSYAHRKGNAIRIEKVAGIRNAPELRHIAGAVAAKFRGVAAAGAFGVVGIVSSYECLVYRERAVAVQILDGDRQPRDSLTVNGGSQNAIAEGEVDHGIRRRLRGAGLDSDHAVGSGQLAVDGIEILVLTLDDAGCGDDVGTGLGEAQGHGTVSVGRLASDGLEAAVLPGAYGNVADSLEFGVVAGEILACGGQGQGEFLTDFHGDLGLIKLAQTVGQVRGVLQNGGVQLVALGHGAGAVVDRLLQNRAVFEEDGASGVLAPELGHGSTVQGVAVLTVGKVSLVQGNQGLIVGQHAVGVDIRNGNGQLDHCRLTIGGLRQQALLTEREVDRRAIGGLHQLQRCLGLLGGSLGGGLRSGSLGGGLRRSLGFGSFRFGSLRYRRLRFQHFCLNDRSLRLRSNRYGFLCRFVREDAGRDHADQHHEGQQQCQYPSFHRILPFRRTPQGMPDKLSPRLSPLTTNHEGRRENAAIPSVTRISPQPFSATL